MTSNNGNGLGISAVDAQKVVDSIREGKGAHNLGEIDLKDAILLLMTSLEHQKSIVSRTLLMKEVFLLYEEVFKPYGLSQGASDAEFFGYIYGPYSRKVNVSISLLLYYPQLSAHQLRKFQVHFRCYSSYHLKIQNHVSKTLTAFLYSRACKNNSHLSEFNAKV